MENLEKKLAEILADPHVYEILSAWIGMRAEGALVGALMEAGNLDAVIRSLCFRGRYNELDELKDELEALHEKGQKELKNQ